MIRGKLLDKWYVYRYNDDPTLLIREWERDKRGDGYRESNRKSTTNRVTVSTSRGDRGVVIKQDISGLRMDFLTDQNFYPADN